MDFIPRAGLYGRGDVWMNQRFGGKFSPKPKSERNVATVDYTKAHWLKRVRIATYVMGAAGALAILEGEPLKAVVAIGAAVGIYGATFLISEGLEAEAEFNARVIARPPAWPRKFIGSFGIGLGVFAANLLGIGNGLGMSLGMGALATGGLVMAFGLDPMRSKGLSGVNSHEASRAAEAIERAEALLAEIKELARGIKDRRLNLEVENLAISVEDMFHNIEQNPGEYRNARRYLSVYLKGARDATSQFLNLPKPQQTASEAKDKYTALIRELDAGFRKKSQLLLEDKRSELDVEIDVLRDRLAAEGIKISKEDSL